ncbi:MAG: hypothetical protein F6J97_17860, partial [Leptolyngbya sp. SIO4C1]|nr:hypothetical protein [Leptolyngbya sp. SIO4C1]
MSINGFAWFSRSQIRACTAILLSLLVWGLSATSSWAQTACPYATLRLDTAQAVDREAICQAAQAWSDRGYQMLVYLTDRPFSTEDEWFAHLDQVESEAGLRDLSQPDSFEKAGFAIEAQTAAANGALRVSVTYGEALYD